MPQQKILFLSVSAGAGHMRAAEAVHLTAASELATDVETMASGRDGLSF